MSLEETRIVRATPSSIIRPRTGIMSDVNVCIDSKLADVRADAKASPGGSFVWGNYLGRSDEATARRLRGSGVRATSHHPNCGMAKVAAEKALGHSVSQSDADEWARQTTRKAAKKHGYGVIGFKKSDMCDCPDNSTIHIIRPGVKNAPLSGFRINSITQNPVEAERIARVVGTSRGATGINTFIHSTSQKDADKMKARLGHSTVSTNVTRRR